MVEDCFPATYSDGCARFLSARLDARVPVASYRNPRSGPQGEALYADAALVGRAEAESVVGVTFSTHGVEGFAGSGIQVGLLRDARAPEPSADTALLLIHALNPFIPTHFQVVCWATRKGLVYEPRADEYTQAESLTVTQ